MALLIPTIILFGEAPFREAPAWDYFLLLTSGVLGLGICDTLFFKSLNILGAGLSAIVVCLYSPTIIMLSILFLGETLTLWQVIGATLIVSAVLLASFESNGSGIDRKEILKGIAYGAVGQLVNGIGIVMVKPLLSRSPVMWAAEIRLMGGAVAVPLMILLHRRRREIVKSIFSRHRWGYTVSSSITGAYLAMMLWLAGMKFTQASTASALNQTSSIFVFVLAWLILKERVTIARVVGIVLAVGGAVLVTFG